MKLGRVSGTKLKVVMLMRNRLKFRFEKTEIDVNANQADNYSLLESYSSNE